MLHNEVTGEKVSNMQKPDRDDSLSCHGHSFTQSSTPEGFVGPFYEL